ncbi:MAG: type II toxin-antitoxin system RelE/ParE family toxin [Saprospiraceae bacterium]|nr:type II toxin-antitoxin system RelE/ParE family toxin [Saprospiraceae bacterium]
MNVEFKTSFLSDLRKIKNEKIVLLVKEIIDELLLIDDLKKVKNLKKLVGSDNAFRIRVRDFRIGLLVVDQTIVLSRILNRKDIYKYFPK